ncbi:hypothetical protein OIO90_002505 [Microbotryomycetes sp. JL221]|nr:hypothetical protein OIO90_002505 [Microbotryomycetes sp. JL221]
MDNTLKQRLAALRVPRTKAAGTPAASEDTAHDPPSNNDDTQVIAARLAALDSPSKHADNITTPLSVQVKNLDPDVEQEVQDYLSKASQLSLSPPKTMPSALTGASEKATLSTLSVLERRAPLAEMGTTTSPTTSNWSPIEVTFMPSPTLAETSEAEQRQLMAKLQDELSLESAVNRRNEQGVDAWQARLEKIKQFKPEATPIRAAESRSWPNGAPPSIEEFERARVNERRHRKQGDRDSDDSEEEASESDDKSSTSGSDDSVAV